MFEEEPPEEGGYWVRASFGCLPPVLAIYWVMSSEWTYDMPGGGSVQLPYWAYRYWRAP